MFKAKGVGGWLAYFNAKSMTQFKTTITLISPHLALLLTNKQAQAQGQSIKMSTVVATQKYKNQSKGEEDGVSIPLLCLQAASSLVGLSLNGLSHSGRYHALISSPTPCPMHPHIPTCSPQILTHAKVIWGGTIW